MTVIAVNRPGIGHRDAEIYDGVLNSTSTPVLGEAVYYNTSLRLVKSNAGAAGTAKFAGIVISTIDQGASILKRGFVGGLDVSGMAVGAKIYLSDTAGKFDTAAGTVSAVVGVVAVNGEKKEAYLDADWLNLVGG